MRAASASSFIASNSVPNGYNFESRLKQTARARRGGGTAVDNVPTKLIIATTLELQTAAAIRWTLESVYEVEKELHIRMIRAS